MKGGPGKASPRVKQLKYLGLRINVKVGGLEEKENVFGGVRQDRGGQDEKEVPGGDAASRDQEGSRVRGTSGAVSIPLNTAGRKETVILSTHRKRQSQPVNRAHSKLMRGDAVTRLGEATENWGRRGERATEGTH